MVRLHFGLLRSAMLSPSVILSAAPQLCFIRDSLSRGAKNPEDVSATMLRQGVLTKLLFVVVLSDYSALRHVSCNLELIE